MGKRRKGRQEAPRMGSVPGSRSSRGSEETIADQEFLQEAAGMDILEEEDEEEDFEEEEEEEEEDEGEVPATVEITEIDPTGDLRDMLEAQGAAYAEIKMAMESMEERINILWKATSKWIHLR